MGFRASPEIRDPFQGFLDRLRALGATDQEVGWVVESWDDPDATIDDRRALMSKSDPALRKLLAASRSGELAEHAFTEGAPDDSGAPMSAAEAADRDRAALAEAQAAWDFDRGANFNLDQLAAWVGENVARAKVARSAELANPDGPRKGAIELFARLGV